MSFSLFIHTFLSSHIRMLFFLNTMDRSFEECVRYGQRIKLKLGYFFLREVVN